MHRVRRAVGDIAPEVRGHHADRAGDQPHRDDRQPLHDAQERRRPRNADPPADRDDPRRAGGGREPGRRTDRTHDRGGCVGATDELGHADREEALERDHREAPERFHQHDPAEDARRAQQPQPVADHTWHRPDRRRDRLRVAWPRRLHHQRGDRDEVDCVQHQCDHERQQQGIPTRHRVECHERAGRERAQRDRDAEGSRSAAETVLDLARSGPRPASRLRTTPRAARNRARGRCPAGPSRP